MMEDWRITLASALARIPDDPAADRYAEPLRHGTMRLGLYTPSWSDEQAPHRQDELYIVARGTGGFVKNGEHIQFAPNDVLFVEAGAEHRFVDFSDDFAAWVVFWGPHGGESSAE